MVGIYPRQSIEKKDSLSIEQQIQKCVDLCNMNGWEYKIYGKDKGYSGKNMKRPSFEEMMEDVHAGVIDKILCYKLDRISRNISDFSNLLVDLQEYHCEFISISESFDTTSPIGRAMIYICMVFAQMERENIAQRVHDNYYYRTERGFWGGGIAPYGYKLQRITHDGKKHTVLAVDEDTAKIVKMIYEEYNSPSGSVSTILKKLNTQMHIPSKNGATWTSRVLVDILERPLYAPNDMQIYNYLKSVGAVISDQPSQFDGSLSVDLYGIKDDKFQKHKRSRKIENMYCNISYHDAIIDSDTWISVQHKRKKMAKIPNRTSTGEHSVFTGLMKCACCGKRVSWTNSRGTEGYYICSTRKNKGWNFCDGATMSKKLYDPIILESIITHYTDPDVIKMVKVAQPIAKKVDDSKKNELLRKIAEIDMQIDKLINSLFELSDTTAKYINDKIELLDKERTSINLKLLNMDEAAYQSKYALSQIERISDDIDKIPEVLSENNFEDTKTMVHQLVKEINFTKNKEIIIEYTI